VGQAVRAARLLREHGIIVTGSLLLGGPGETLESPEERWRAARLNWIFQAGGAPKSAPSFANPGQEAEKGGPLAALGGHALRPTLEAVYPIQHTLVVRSVRICHPGGVVICYKGHDRQDGVGASQ
jgi:hypothetical protein